MTAFVSRDDTNLGVGRIFTSPTAYALYENLFAFAEKASGAPVLANGYVVEAMLGAGAVTTTKLASGEQMTTTNVLATTAGASVGAVGTYAFLENLSTAAGAGNVIGGSNLDYADDTAGGSTVSPAGSWRCMGDAATGRATVWLRIS
jgi:hypothetical protein